MLHSLELENFKAFGERARIPFAPITLIFGENSAGKSSILQALNLLKQTRESRDVSAPIAPRTENGIVDLGSFKELIFDHDLERTLSMRIEIKLDVYFSIEFRFKRPSLTEEVLLDQVMIYKNKTPRCIAKFKPIDKPLEFEEIRRGTRFLFNPFIVEKQGYAQSRMPTLKCDWLTKAKLFWEHEFNWCQENSEKVINLIKEEKNRLEEHLNRLKETYKRIDQKKSEDSFKDSYRQELQELKSLKQNIDFFTKEYDLNEYISKRHADEMRTIVGLQGFLPAAIGYQENITRSLSFIHYRSSDPLDLGEIVMDTASALETTLESLFPMGPFRRPPERWYIFTGTSPQDVGYRGDLLPDLLFRRPELVEDTNKWLERLEIGYQLEVKPVGTDAGDLFEVRLIDTRRKERVNVALPDVGFGISQLLPFVVQSLVSEKQIISIEQPEVHVHPRLQADLGDLLAAAIQKPRQNQFIIETHSEHLILRLQRLVYEKKINPNDISVIYVSRGAEGAKSQRLRLDEKGNFIDNWPSGFFTERLKELR